jgi:hypothetical protein
MRVLAKTGRASEVASDQFISWKDFDRSVEGFPMRRLSIIVATIAVLTSACATRVPKPAGIAPGTPYVSWIIMSGDRDNPDQEFVCQSDPRTECVIPASRPEAQVFSDVHIYYHGTGAETKYTGSIEIGFFQGGPESHRIQPNITVRKADSIANQSVVGIVTATPGTYAVTFAIVAAVTGNSQPIREQVPVAVK